jgi:myo-inositol catabolism protein IolC
MHAKRLHLYYVKQLFICSVVGSFDIHHMHIICKTEKPAKQLVILAMAHIHYFDECVEEVRARQQHIYRLRTYVVSEEETSQLVPTKRSGCMHDTVTVAPNFAIEWT